MQNADLIFDDLSELAESKEINAVYIASPNSLHAAQTIQMLNGGKHVLCEKSIASNQYEFEQMQKDALKNRKVLLEAMRSVYSPGLVAIRENLSKLGTIRRASFQYCQYFRIRRMSISITEMEEWNIWIFRMIQCKDR